MRNRAHPIAVSALLLAACTCAGEPGPRRDHQGTTATEDNPVRAKHREHAGRCDRFVESIGSAGPIRALFERDQWRHIASHGRLIGQYLSCRAIALDDAARCGAVEEPSDRFQCRERVERFRALKQGDGSKRWLFTDAEYERCKALPMADACDAFREVARSGDLDRCPKGDYEAYCRALFRVDSSQCRGGGPEAEGIEELCRQALDEKGSARDGLDALARSGPPTEQMYARAALGRPDACRELMRRLSDVCTKSLDQADAPELE